MKHSLSTVTCLMTALLVAGCVSVEVSDISTDTGSASSSVSSEPAEQLPIQETKNVFYTGVVKPAGISIYNEGSHKLVLDDGRMILLESEVLDLNGYVSERVDVFGAVRPTVEGAGSIMRVERVKLVIALEELEDVEELEEVEEAENTDELQEAKDAEDASDAEENVTETEEVDEVEQVEQKQEVIQEVSISPELMSRIEKMALHSTESSEWTQQYCSSHIGFCIPVHRNWWYRSYGATTSSLWHLEFSPVDMSDLSIGDSPLILKLHGGSLKEVGIEDGSSKSLSNSITIYKDWNGYQYFTISGHPTLLDAISYLSDHIRPYNGE